MVELKPIVTATADGSRWGLAGLSSWKVPDRSSYGALQGWVAALAFAPYPFQSQTCLSHPGVRLQARQRAAGTSGGLGVSRWCLSSTEPIGRTMRPVRAVNAVGAAACAAAAGGAVSGGGAVVGRLLQLLVRCWLLPAGSSAGAGATAAVVSVITATSMYRQVAQRQRGGP